MLSVVKLNAVMLAVVVLNDMALCKASSLGVDLYFGVNLLLFFNKLGHFLYKKQFC